MVYFWTAQIIRVLRNDGTSSDTLFDLKKKKILIIILVYKMVTFFFF